MPHAASQTFIPTREAGLARLAEFLPRAGGAYARDRNDDRGPDDRGNVSMLSPWLRHRLLTEHEVVAAAIAMHGDHGARKFVQEVLWRTYWKGWLQLRPSVWRDFLVERDAERASVDADPKLAARLTHAEAGDAGIDGFDQWARELVETGYLHNHARMWFASIWIFTLRLPWALGADFFLRHLIDADPASNTLSWRWVAGLQTVGKPYVATADNIARCTQGRFRPKRLATDVVALDAAAMPAAHRLAPADALTGGGHALLLVTPEDLHPECLALGDVDIAATLCVRGCDAPQPWPWGALARDFVGSAVDDVATRLRAARSHGAVEVTDAPSSVAVVDAARDAGVDTVLTAEAAIGPMADALDDLRAALAAEGIALLRVRRDWDAHFWPHATRGFFPFREKIDDTLRALGLPV